jgi:hypothetical protein
MRNNYIFLAICVIAFLSLANCSEKAKYERMVQDGLESGERHDTLFLGLWLGMTSEEFYKKCWDLNKEGLVKQGEGNTSVLYKMGDELKATVNVNFFPEFYNDKIYQMPVTFQYEAWAPWNMEFSGDTLHHELLGVFERWYGTGFMEVEKKDNAGKAYVKVDGNRRISLYKGVNADGIVWALYTDMSVDEEVKAAKSKDKK